VILRLKFHHQDNSSSDMNSHLDRLCHRGIKYVKD